MTTVENPYLTGNYAPVSEEITATDLKVEGVIPAELDGRYIRNGPNPASETVPDNFHWFTGDGMVHGVRIRGGKAEWYRNRYVRGPETSAALSEEPLPDPFGGEKGLSSPNTNVIGHAGRTFAIVEAGGIPMELDYELNTLGYCDFDGTLPYAFSAHPHLEASTGELHTVAYYWGWGNQVQYIRSGVDGKVVQTVDVPTTGSPMVHDMAFTDRYILILDLPCVFDLDDAMAGSSLPYRWKEDYPARIGLLRRDGGADDVVWCEIDSCYIFHPMNAYDDADGNVVLDAIRHPKMFATKVTGPNEGVPLLERWTLNPATGCSSQTNISEIGQEFPRLNEANFGKPYRYGYTVGANERLDPHALLKHDMNTGEVLRHDVPGRQHLEPVFVPREGATAEDDGWIMAYAYNVEANSGEVVIIDAQDFAADPIATITLPQRVPFGFHGNWVSG
ncbi:carotenoid oxygenase family protein [Acidimicrobiaceae bacterium AH-315-P05]|nr:carotenoid oxygenase family protein [Acidimicrobiaceae bacterium AH-315-P05]